VIREDFAREEDLLRGQVDLQVAARVRASVVDDVDLRRAQAERAFDETVSVGTIVFGPPVGSLAACVRSAPATRDSTRTPPMMGTDVAARVIAVLGADDNVHDGLRCQTTNLVDKLLRHRRCALPVGHQHAGVGDDDRSFVRYPKPPL
jgi:hypothetical protein